MNALTKIDAAFLPPAIHAGGEPACRRFLEFFTANIRNANTRKAYAQAAGDFMAWCADRGVTALPAIQPVHVAMWIEELGRSHSVPTVKLRLAAIRHLFDWMVTGQIMPSNPAHAVRGPAYSTKKGKTPVLTPQEARQLLDSIPGDTMAGKRDRALIGLMTYSFARIGAALSMEVRDVFVQNRRYWVRLHEKGGKLHEVPVHHKSEEMIDSYLDQTAIRLEPKSPLWRSADRRTKRLTGKPMSRVDAFRMIKRRALKAGLDPLSICCHSFRATGITVFIENGGRLETAAQIAAHESPRTTKLYDRTNDKIALEEIERIRL